MPGGRLVGTGSSHVDYSLARRSVLVAFRSGRVSRLDICDAHPDLIRAARSMGEATTLQCPICDTGSLVLVSYVFSDELPKRENGRTWPRDDLAPLLKLGEVRLYTVEVCPGCSWNHLRSQLTMGRGRRRARRGSRAST
ncbi:MAG: DUF5318 family protein [Actinomycetota bacterium]